MSYLSWISDEKLTEACNNLILSVRQGQINAEKKFSRNVCDPFGVAFSMALFDLSAEEWKNNEINRQLDKALSNAIGLFHQQILGNINGWFDLQTSNQVDLLNQKQKIIADIKNKHNTLNADGLVTLYRKLSEMVNSKTSFFRGYTAYYVMIVPKSPEGVNNMFFPSDPSTGEHCKQDSKIRMIDGKRFYDLASGKEGALEELFIILPVVLNKLCQKTLNRKSIAFINEIFDKAYVNH